MTLKDLKRLHSLNKEIEYERRRLRALQKAGHSVSLIGVGMIQRDDFCAELDALEKSIEAHLNECLALYKEILDFINGIDDALIRLIISLKHISALEWEQIALHIGGGNTAESLRKIYERFIKKAFPPSSSL